MPSALPDGDPAPPDGALPEQALATVAKEPFGFYVHVPFCSVRCGYCDFNTYTASELGGGASRASYAETAIAEIRLARRVLGEVDVPVETVFFGGGTPTLLPPADLAAILGAIPKEENLRPLIRDPEAAGKRWSEKHGAIQLNHLVVVKNSVSRDMADEVYRLLVESKKTAGNPPMLPHGLEANRRNLEVAIDCAYKQALIPRRFSVDELFE